MRGEQKEEAVSSAAWEGGRREMTETVGEKLRVSAFERACVCGYKLPEEPEAGCTLAEAAALRLCDTLPQLNVMCACACVVG
eukprot:6214422-Pleurochrysis_carterae.AAC.1